jgi:hypothetical protein
MQRKEGIFWVQRIHACMLPDGRSAFLLTAPRLSLIPYDSVSLQISSLSIFIGKVTDSGTPHKCWHWATGDDDVMNEMSSVHCRVLQYLLIVQQHTCMVCCKSKLFMGMCGLLCAWWKVQEYIMYYMNIIELSMPLFPYCTALLFSLPSHVEVLRVVTWLHHS